MSNEPRKRGSARFFQNYPDTLFRVRGRGGNRGVLGISNVWISSDSMQVRARNCSFDSKRLDSVVQSGNVIHRGTGCLCKLTSGYQTAIVDRKGVNPAVHA